MKPDSTETIVPALERQYEKLLAEDPAAAEKLRYIIDQIKAIQSK